MASAREWARGFAKQAAADFDTWNALQLHLRPPQGAPPVPMRQKLHFLQMACEKLAKAHRLLAGDDPAKVQSGHAFAAKHLETIFRQLLTARPDLCPKPEYVLSRVRPLAREIELLSPALKAGGKRHDNCEYPWEDANGKLHIPAEISFPIHNQILTDKAGRVFLKLVRESALRLIV